eukprot:CAMPEP_0180504360 /NCGR_PEP_ID=MMETSP1036_2-20121128/46667_1 /TAXON_ID=632150 /ORGANISM="Azadinium spinosum, Strain 3D9" /LENGTH=134 /DNA_ID=CAMNT_0022513735 /DNA_START=248 /DNA_END=649 /DNA_ORIENTATION=+
MVTYGRPDHTEIEDADEGGPIKEDLELEGMIQVNWVAPPALKASSGSEVALSPSTKLMQAGAGSQGWRNATFEVSNALDSGRWRRAGGPEAAAATVVRLAATSKAASSTAMRVPRVLAMSAGSWLPGKATIHKT